MMSYPLFNEVPDLASVGHLVADGTHLLRARSFTVAYSKGSGEWDVDVPEEYFLLLPDTGATLDWDGARIEAPAHSVVIMPAGISNARLNQAGSCARIFAAVPPAFSHIAMFGGTGEAPLLRPVVQYARRTPIVAPVIYQLDALPNSVGMPRAKLFQTETMSINWVEYVGRRDRGNLSPHNHDDIEQGSLALDGQFIHHFRHNWGKDADQWRNDEHVDAGSGSVALIPPPVIHTSEGVGAGRHILIDIFSPPRADFIAKGQVLNAEEYQVRTL